MNATRPHMPDYPIEPGPGGLLPWAWATERLTTSRHYWVATTWPDGRPHVSPVWAVWHEGALWFSCGPRSRKARNLDHDPRCTVTTGDPAEPVIVEGAAERLTQRHHAETYAALATAKYDAEQDADFYAANALFRVTPRTVIGMAEEAFTTSPTRWVPGPADT